MSDIVDDLIISSWKGFPQPLVTRAVDEITRLRDEVKRKDAQIREAISRLLGGVNEG